MPKLRKYYKVRMSDGTEHNVSSLAKAKKLIQGQSDWRIAKFSIRDTIGSIQCHGVTWKEYMDIMKKYKWRSLGEMDCDRLTLAIHKSRIAK